jgi:hypothetical protein
VEPVRGKPCGVQRLVLLVLIPAAATACSSKDNATIQLNTGAETDTFTETPVPTSLVVQAWSAPDAGTTIADVPFPATSVDLGDQSEANEAIITVSGIDANNATVVYGASLYLDFGSLAGDTVPIFVQRVGETARLPGTLDLRTSPLLSSLQAEYVFVAGANEQAFASTTQLYDFEQLAPLPSAPAMPVIPLSMAVIGTVAMLFDGTSDASDTGATYFDLSANETAQVPALANQYNYTFADVAGGQTVVASDGTTFVVGGTRTIGSPTAAVLEINPNDSSNTSYVSGNLTWLSLSAPRFGAAATWVDGHGVVVAGGSPTAAGVEVLAEGSTMSTPLTYYAPDLSTGAGATTTDDLDTVVLAGGLLPSGGDAGVRAVLLSGCTAAPCSPTPWTSLSPPIGTANAFDIDPTHILVVGNELGSGATHVFMVTSGSPGSSMELPTKVPHTNASAIVSPVGSVVILGGNDLMESVQLLAPPGG